MAIRSIQSSTKLLFVSSAWLVAAAALGTGCEAKSDSKGSAPEKTSSAKADSKGKGKDEKAKAAASVAASAEKVAEEKALPKGPDPAPPPATPEASASAAEAPLPAPPTKMELPPGRSSMPTLEEWASQKEVNVKGSTALNCETKMVREYLRVSCRGKNDTGGTPTTVQTVRGAREALLFASGGITSLIIPFVEGIEATVQFSWTDKSHPLVLKWPKSTPKPGILGAFEGAKSPLDAAPEEALLATLCACHKQITRDATCENLIGGPNPDCDRTYRGDCQRLLECSRGEPSAFPACLPGFSNAFTGHFCARNCEPGGGCPAGHSCMEVPHPVCIAD